MKEIRPTIKPTIKQHLAWQKLLDDRTKYIVFGGGAGGGKSWLGAEWIITNCYKHPGSKWFIGREELKRLMSSSYITFIKVCKYHGIPDGDWKLNGQYNYIEFTNGSRVDLLDLSYQPRDPMYERFGSLEYTGGWIEEAGEVNFKAFDVLKTRIGRHMNKEFSLIPKMFLSCNPNKGWLYREVYKPFRDKLLDPKFAYIESLYGDNPHTATEYQEQLSDIKDKATKQRLMYGNWEYDDSDNALVDYDSIIDMFTNEVEDSSERFLIADLARFGGDRIVISIWHGMKCVNIKWYRKQDLDTTTQLIREASVKHNVPRSHVLVDEDGVGGGVKDFLKGIKGFVNNSSPFEEKDEGDNNKMKRPNYQNLKTQCAYKLADFINQRIIRVDIEDEDVIDWIIEELEQLKRPPEEDDNKKLRIIPKEEMKEMLGRSPDFLDTLIMRMYYEVAIVVKRGVKQIKPKSSPRRR